MNMIAENKEVAEPIITRIMYLSDEISCMLSGFLEVIVI